MQKFILTLLFALATFYAQEKSVLVCYYSGGGHTEQMAEAVAEGARSVTGVSVTLQEISAVADSQLIASQAIIIGSPVYNGNVAPEIQQFINNWPFLGSPMKDKVGAAFATGGGISAGEELVQLSILHSMMIFGMIVAGGPDWQSAFGASAITEEKPFDQTAGVVQEPFLAKGRALGKRIAELVLKIE